MTNLLYNPSFELGWQDVIYHGRSCQVPNGYTLSVAAIGSRLLSAGAFVGVDHDPALETARTIPEIVHKLTSQLPPDERAGGSHALILDGLKTFKGFIGNLPYSYTLSQTLSGLTPGATVALTIPVQVHYNPKPGGDGSPGACAFRAFCGATEGAWLTFGSGLSDRQWSTVTLYAIVPADGNLTVGATFESRSEAGIDFFTDAWRLEYSDDPEPPTPPECYGLPREDYVRVVNVVPVDATRNRYLTIAATAWDRGRQTVTGSYDDAGIGDLSDKTAVLWDIPAADRDEFAGFYAEHYPGTLVRFEGEGTGGTTPPVTPTDPPPPPPSEPQHPDPGILIGLHSQRPKTGWLDYYRKTRASIFKGFELGMCIEAKRASPNTLVVYRKHVSDDAGPIHAPDLKVSARAFLDLYSREFELHARNTGMTVAQVLQHIDVIESVNEVIGTHDPDLEPSVVFEIEFMRAIEERYGNAVKAGILTVAVGNPHESEFIKLLPAARKAHQGGHYIAYHPYWAGNRSASYLLPHWTYHAGRWMEWDRVFRAHGVYPLHYGGEAGAVFSTDGWTLHSGLGWKDCGPFSRYIGEMLEFQAKCRTWNQLHGNRFRGATIFCYGGHNWPRFDFEPGDLAELGEALT